MVNESLVLQFPYATQMPEGSEARLELVTKRWRAPEDLQRLGREFLFIALALGLPFGLCTAAMMFRDGDVSWQVAAGKWILQHGRIPTTDPFSYTALGHRWVAMEWLAEAIFASAFNIDGYAGLATIVAAALICLFVLVYFYLEKRASPTALAITIVMLAVVLAPFVLARPHVLAWPLLAGWTILLSRAAETNRPPSIWATSLLVIWTNLHASFPLAILVEAAIAVDALRGSGWSMVRPWLVFGVCSILALMFNANGLAGLRQPFDTTSLTTLPFIAEWHASTTNSTPYFFGVLIVGVGTLLYSGVRVPLGRLLLLLFLLWMAFLHVRHQSMFIIVAACVLPPFVCMQRNFSRVPRPLLLAALPLLAFKAWTPILPPEGPANPRSLLAAIPAEFRNSPVLNEYTFGGPLILRGIRPYIDGRTEVYGDAFLENYFKIMDGDKNLFDEAVERNHIKWTMLSGREAKLIASIEASGEWRRIYSDKIGVLDVRQTRSAAVPSPPPERTNRGHAARF